MCNTANYDSWEAFDETRQRHKQGGRFTPDQGAYLPSPDQIEIRKAMLAELRSYEFNERFICSIMQHDTPTIEVVRRMVQRYGPEETWRRCKHFLAVTEYDHEQN